MLGEPALAAWLRNCGLCIESTLYVLLMAFCLDCSVHVNSRVGLLLCARFSSHRHGDLLVDDGHLLCDVACKTLYLTRIPLNVSGYLMSPVSGTQKRVILLKLLSRTETLRT
jgi:hypothetical protein